MAGYIGPGSAAQRFGGFAAALRCARDDNLEVVSPEPIYSAAGACANSGGVGMNFSIFGTALCRRMSASQSEWMRGSWSSYSTWSPPSFTLFDTAGLSPSLAPIREMRLAVVVG